MKRFDWSTLDAAGRIEALARPQRRTEARVSDTVRGIMDDVRTRGGAAVTDWSLKLDGAAPRRLALTPDRVAAARDALRPADTRAIRMAAENIRIFHEATRPEDTPDVEIIPGVRSRLVWRPLRSAGLYAPGGSAPLFSSLLMLAIPAAVAGVGRRVAVTPPSPSGEPHPAMIFAAAEAGLDALWLIGGAQAIAALTFGAELDDGVIAPCDKLFGPGNAWVAEAKKQASARPAGMSTDGPPGRALTCFLASATQALPGPNSLSHGEMTPSSSSAPKVRAAMAWAPPTSHNSSSPASAAAKIMAGWGSPALDGGVTATRRPTPATAAGMAIINSDENSGAEPPGT